jgi:hypothetical protein
MLEGVPLVLDREFCGEEDLEALELYRKRMKIEEQFRDLKSEDVPDGEDDAEEA